MSQEPRIVPGTDIALYDQAVWTRNTVADGNYLQSTTLGPISSNDRILASAIASGDAALYDYIDTNVSSIYEDIDTLQTEIDEVSAYSENLYNTLIVVSGTIRNEVTNEIEEAKEDVCNIINTTVNNTSSVLQGQIDTLKNATDVVDVVGNYDELTAYNLGLTKNDIIKVLDCTYDIYSGEQVYWRYTGDNISAGTVPQVNEWVAVGALDPYYSTSQIDEMSAYLDVQPGYGLATGVDGNHKVIGMIQRSCTGGTGGGHDGDFSYALGYYSEANKGLQGFASFAFGANTTADGTDSFAAGNGDHASGRFSVAIGYTNLASGNYSVAMGRENSAMAENSIAIGRGLIGNAPVTLGWFNEDVVGQFIIGCGRDAGYDVTARKNILLIRNDCVSAADFSAGNVSLSSLKSISAKGNGITNTWTNPLSSVYLSAGRNVTFTTASNSNKLTMSVSGHVLPPIESTAYNTNVEIDNSGNIIYTQPTIKYISANQGGVIQELNTKFSGYYGSTLTGSINSALNVFGDAYGFYPSTGFARGGENLVIPMTDGEWITTAYSGSSGCKVFAHTKSGVSHEYKWIDSTMTEIVVYNEANPPTAEELFNKVITAIHKTDGPVVLKIVNGHITVEEYLPMTKYRSAGGYTSITFGIPDAEGMYFEIAYSAQTQAYTITKSDRSRIHGIDDQGDLTGLSVTITGTGENGTLSMNEDFYSYNWLPGEWDDYHVPLLTLYDPDDTMCERRGTIFIRCGFMADPNYYSHNQLPTLYYNSVFGVTHQGVYAGEADCNFTSFIMLEAVKFGNNNCWIAHGLNGAGLK